MATSLEITCIRKTNRSDPHERIETVGGSGFRHSQPDAIAYAENGAYTYWTQGGGKRANVVVAVHNGHKYLKTENDGVQPNNLLALPTCS